MPATHIEISKPCVLVVEGREEELFFGALANHLGLKEIIQILPIGGKVKLRESLKALVVTPGFADVISLGVVRDADEDPAAAFQSVCDALMAAGLPAPKCPLTPVGHSPCVTVMILPGNSEPGTLEDLCLKAVSRDPVMCCVKRFFICLQRKGIPEPDNLSKAKVQVFLASKPRAGLRLGEAAQAGYWPWDNPAFEQVRDFLRQIASV